MNLKGKNGETPLSLAAAKNRTDILTLLLDHKAEINTKNIQNQTPLDIAAYYGLKANVELLLAGGPIFAPKTTMA